MLPDDWRVFDPRDSKGGEVSGGKCSIPVGGAREVHRVVESNPLTATRKTFGVDDVVDDVDVDNTRALQVIVVMLGGGNWAEEAQVCTCDYRRIYLVAAASSAGR